MINFDLTDTCDVPKRDGTPCTMRRTRLGTCIFHDPTEQARQRRVENARRAGKASVAARRRRKERARALGAVKLKTAEEALELVEKTIGESREGVLDATRARLQLKAAQIVLGYTLGEDVERRLTDLETLVQEYELANPAALAATEAAKDRVRREPWRRSKP